MVVVWQRPVSVVPPPWFVDAFDASAGSATRLKVTTVTTTKAERNPLISAVILVRHNPTNSRKVTARSSLQIMRTFVAMIVNPIRPCTVNLSGSCAVCVA